MSTNLATKSLTVQQRPAESARQVADYLGLEDAKRVSAALAEIAAEEVRASRAFAERVRDRYHALAPSKPARSRPANADIAGAARPRRAPVKRVEGYEVDLAKPLDPHQLLELYGADGLADALTPYAAKQLLAMAALVQPRFVDKRPTTKATKADIIAYIMRHVAGTRD